MPLTSRSVFCRRRSAYAAAFVCAFAVGFSPAVSAQTVTSYPAIEEHQGGDCGETDLPMCRVRRAWSPDTLRARLGDESNGESTVWRSSPDEVTFAFRGAATEVSACCSIQMPLARLDGTDLWALSVRVPDADRLAMSVLFFVRDSAAGTSRRVEGKPWAGPLAEPMPPTVDVLAGTIRTDSLDSDALGTRRAVTVYLPPSWRGEPHRVIYLADGQQTEDYARVIEPAIQAGAVPPVALVGIHNAARDREPGNPVDGRSREYLAGLDSARYAAHEQFVLDEVLPWAEATYGVSFVPADRAVFGTSNGASFAAAMLRRHPTLFHSALSFSHAYDGLDPDDDLDLAGRRFFFVAGQLEPSFEARQREVAGIVAAHGASVHQEIGISGHDQAMWLRAFPRAVAWAFGE